MADLPMEKPVLLIIRDGWGWNPDPKQNQYNATHLAATPVDDALQRQWPFTRIMASGLDVGVPVGVMGNSEVGHQNIGAGRIVDQEIVRITKEFAEGSFADNEIWKLAVERVRVGGGKLHLFGLVSDAGVHAMLEHLYGLLELCAEAGIGDQVYVHAFTDGRDTSPTSGLGYVKELEEKCRSFGAGKVVTVCGRFWSMDRDNRWERVAKAYDCLVGKRAEHEAASASDAVQHYYDNPIDDSRKGDEFIVPTWIIDESGRPVGRVSDGDTVVFFNFRGDRPRELTKAFVLDDFDGFDRGEKLDLFYATMTEYQTGLPVEVILRKPPKMKNILGMYLSDLGIAQFRCAETEKYPHVTFFFNDYREEPFPLEERGVIPSPKVSTYDLQPEMSARGVIEAAREAILSRKFGFVVVNFANPDMVGHTGNIPAVTKAVEVTDQGVGVLLEAIQSIGGAAVVTADHGNAEQMWDAATNGPHTSHTLNPVNVFLVGEGCRGLKLRESGRLADLAPTILDLMGLPKPVEMTGESLIIP
jgi:2,3-bisphosphoglycerate-independent phosphoglycerate mutase